MQILLEQRVRELEALVSQQQATIEQYHEQLERATEQITLLKKALFSPRRERYVDSPDQKRLFAPSAEGELDGTADQDGVQDTADQSVSRQEPPAGSATDRSSVPRNGSCSHSSCRGSAKNIRCLRKNSLAAVAAKSESSLESE